MCPSQERFALLFTFLKKNRDKKVMVFMSSCAAVKYFHELLNYIDLPVTCIHVRFLHCCYPTEERCLQGKQKQQKRTTTFFQFTSAQAQTLLCTDVAARGLDIPKVDWIVQYDPPDDPKVSASLPVSFRELFYRSTFTVLVELRVARARSDMRC